MAQVVCIAAGSVTPQCEIDDVVSMHRNDVDLTGPGYENFYILFVANRTPVQLRSIWTVPVQRTATKIAAANQWCFVEELRVWKDEAGDWCELVNRPKYRITIAELTPANRVAVADPNTNEAVRQNLLQKAEEKIHLDPANLTEVPDLNA